ncbi:MAG: lipoate--protein ligase family protein [Saprospirales bacterium]|nr:lipoate--protein ligase family protein [Saprospirales bacterium]
MDQHSEGSDGATLRLYTYRDHCALVGRFQNIHAELDLEACMNSGIDFGRRLTGGGAIIMGNEQLGICLAAHSKSFEWGTVRELCGLMARPIIQALKNWASRLRSARKTIWRSTARRSPDWGVRQSAGRFSLSRQPPGRSGYRENALGAAYTRAEIRR